MFNSLSWRVGEVMILTIVLSVIHHQFHVDRHTTKNFHSFVSLATLFALIPATVLFRRKRSLVNLPANAPFHKCTANQAMTQVSILLVAVIVPSLILRILMGLVAKVISYFNISSTIMTIIDFDWVDSFIYCFTTMVIFLTVAVVAMQRPYSEMVRKNSRDKGAGNGVA